MDIIAALNATPPNERRGRCKFQRQLDTIPTDTPGYDQLLELIDTAPASRIAAVFNNLGMLTSRSGITAHRRHDCACYGLT